MVNLSYVSRSISILWPHIHRPIWPTSRKSARFFFLSWEQWKVKQNANCVRSSMQFRCVIWISSNIFGRKKCMKRSRTQTKQTKLTKRTRPNIKQTRARSPQIQVRPQNAHFYFFGAQLWNTFQWTIYVRIGVILVYICAVLWPLCHTRWFIWACCLIWFVGNGSLVSTFFYYHFHRSEPVQLFSFVCVCGFYLTYPQRNDRNDTKTITFFLFFFSVNFVKQFRSEWRSIDENIKRKKKKW